MDMMASHVGTKKFKKRFFLITDGDTKVKINKKEMASIKQQMNQMDAKINIIALDFCDDYAEDSEDEDDGPAGGDEDQEEDKKDDNDGKPDKKGGKV
jgi:hypothetical protein